MGKKNPAEQRPRPLLIKLNNEDEKWLIIKNAKNLKDETDPIKKKIGIAKDLTKKERENQKLLLTELKQKRENDKDNTWTIKNGKVTQIITETSATSETD